MHCLCNFEKVCFQVFLESEDRDMLHPASAPKCMQHVTTKYD